MVSRPHARCPRCGGVVAQRSTGVLQRHRRGEGKCPGSESLPTAPPERTAPQGLRRYESGIKRISVQDPDNHSWNPYGITNEAMDEILELIIELGNFTQKQLNDLYADRWCNLPEGTAQSNVSHVLLAANQAGIVRPLGREGRTSRWEVVDAEAGTASSAD